MGSNLISYAIGLSLFGIVSGCTSVNLNEGSSSYNYFGDNSSAHQIYFKSNEIQSDRLIEAGDNISITLASAYICDFRESSSLSGDFFDQDSNAGSRVCPVSGIGEDGGSSRTTRGEIAILGNVKEGESFVGTNRDDQRVIFFSDDVRESGQLLNLSNKSIYGPIKYNGGYLDVSFSIMELDKKENDRMTAIIAGLANLGGKAYAPASPALKVVNEVGSLILKENKDDLELSYSFRFDPPVSNSGSTIERATLQEGFYAVLRNEDRNEEPAWGEVCLSKKLGMLTECKDQEFSANGKTLKPGKYSTAHYEYELAKEALKDASSNISIADNAANRKALAFAKKMEEEKSKALDLISPEKIYRDKTWLVFRVTKESAAASKSNNELNTFQAFLKSYEASDQLEPLVESLEKLEKALGGLINPKTSKLGAEVSKIQMSLQKLKTDLAEQEAALVNAKAQVKTLKVGIDPNDAISIRKVAIAVEYQNKLEQKISSIQLKLDLLEEKLNVFQQEKLLSDIESISKISPEAAKKLEEILNNGDGAGLIPRPAPIVDVIGG